MPAMSYQSAVLLLRLVPVLCPPPKGTKNKHMVQIIAVLTLVSGHYPVQPRGMP